MEKTEVKLTIIICATPGEASNEQREHQRLHPKWSCNRTTRMSKGIERSIIWTDLERARDKMVGMRAIAIFTDQAGRHMYERQHYQDVAQLADHMNAKYYHI